MQRLIGHPKPVFSVALSPDSQFLASASRDNTVRVWRVGTGQLFTVLTGHDDLVKGIAVSPDGEVTTSGSYYFEGVWVQSQSKGRSARISKTGRSMVSVDGQSICVWTRRDHDTPFSIRLEGHTAAVRSAVISPDGSYVSSASEDGTIRIWDIEDGNESVQSVSTESPPGPDGTPMVLFEGANVVCVSGDAFSVWNAKFGETRPPVQVAGGRNRASLAVSSDGHLIAMGFDDRAQLWSAQTGEKIGEPLYGKKHRVKSLTFTPTRGGSCRQPYAGGTQWRARSKRIIRK